MNEHGQNDNYVVSSLIVLTDREHTTRIEAAVQSLEGAAVETRLHHKLAVVLETSSSESAADLTERIRSMEGVTAVDLVAHFFEDEVLDNRDDRG